MIAVKIVCQSYAEDKARSIAIWWGPDTRPVISIWKSRKKTIKNNFLCGGGGGGHFSWNRGYKEDIETMTPSKESSWRKKSKKANARRKAKSLVDWHISYIQKRWWEDNLARKANMRLWMLHPRIWNSLGIKWKICGKPQLTHMHCLTYTTSIFCM